MDRHEILAVAVSLSVAAAVVLLGILAGAGLFETRSASAAPACSEWTDGCVICARTAQGAACSTPGIACTRGPQRCLKP